MFKITDLEYTIEEYLTSCDMKNLSAKTIKSYDQSLKLFTRFLLQEYKITSIKQLKKIHIEEYVKFTKEKGKYSFVNNEDSKLKNQPQNRKDYEKKVSVSTVNNYLRNIKAFINWCVRERLLKDNIAKTVKHLKASRKPKPKDSLNKICLDKIISIERVKGEPIFIKFIFGQNMETKEYEFVNYNIRIGY